MFINSHLLFKFYNYLVSLKRIYRILILILLDQIILFSSITFGYFINYGFYNFRNVLEPLIFIFIALLILGILNLYTNQYKSKFSYPSGNFIFNIGLRNFLTLSIISILENLVYNEIFNFDIFLTCISFSTILSIFLRLIIRNINIRSNHNLQKIKKKNVVIYGAGSAGLQLAASLKLDPNYKIITFIDDNIYLHNRAIYGIAINSFAFIFENINIIDQFLIAIPSLKPSELKNILDKLQKYNKPVLKVPIIKDLFDGTHKINKLSYVSTRDLIGRDKAEPIMELLNNKIKGSTVFVSGAGGSIGSELCRKIAGLCPNKIILMDLSEHNLYQISQELSNYTSENLDFYKILGNACDKKLISEIFEKFKVDTVFHAAAYKHVPLVELNPIQGIYNNVFSTYNLCLCSEKFKIKNFVLISTDKAVRPSNVMGASKRVAELIIQGFAQDTNKTIFSIVRFGNVLNSSGSVFPLFKDQIEKRMPLTITDPEINRYFMTVSEAADLVIQSSSLATVGGNVFLLDMGDPIKILDMAKKMIALSGLSIKDDSNPEGDIEIKNIGLRPGEKLYEELLIDASATKTAHPRIYKAKEKFIPSKELWEKLKELKKELLNYDKEKSFIIMSSLVEEWVKSV